MSRIDWWLWLGLAVLVAVLVFVVYPALAQQRPHNSVPCWYVPNGVNITFACQNGYWHTTTPEGDVIDGNGPSDPHAAMRGAGLLIDPGTGNINMKGPSIAPATPQPSAADPSSQNYGVWPRRD